MAVVIDSVTPTIQPSRVEWEPREIVARNGQNRPRFSPMRRVALSFEEGMSRAQFSEWHALLTGDLVAATLPRESDGTDTAYTDVAVEAVEGTLRDLNVYDVRVVVSNINDPL
jgi:hypothetical protein